MTEEIRPAHLDADEEFEPEHLDVQLNCGLSLSLQINENTEVSLSDDDLFLHVENENGQVTVPIAGIAYWVRRKCTCTEGLVDEAAAFLRHVVDGGGGEPPTP